MNSNPADYWDFGYEGLIIDVLAQGAAIKANYEQLGGTSKPVYIGYSMGTLQMIAGLSILES